MSAKLCRCGGGRAHHENDFACWCPSCLKCDPSDRCVEFSPHIPITLPRPSRNTPAPDHLTPSPDDAAPTPTGDQIAVEVLSQISGTGGHGATPGEVATLLDLGQRATAAVFKELAAEGKIIARETPRKVGSESEDVWVVPGEPETATTRQITLWA